MSRMVVEIVSTRGSAPRDAGTVMTVCARTSEGTIGGGALEYRAIATARRLLREGAAAFEETIPLGPDLGQCCGGAVRLRYAPATAEAHSQADAPVPLPLRGTRPRAPVPLWVWGAGHVGRAVVRLAKPTGAFDITWIDSAAERFPAQIAPEVSVIPTLNMPRLACHAPQDAYHLIFTYSHEIDFALCATLLRGRFAGCGLIGSETKKARFYKRLRALRLDPARLTCPIGDPAFGKHPDQIAHSTITALLKQAAHAEDSAPDLRTARS